VPGDSNCPEEIEDEYESTKASDTKIDNEIVTSEDFKKLLSKYEKTKAKSKSDFNVSKRKL